MATYYQNLKNKETVKLYDFLKIYYVKVIGFTNGDFLHHRGHLTFANQEEMDCYLRDFEEVDKSRYLLALRDYFAIDKKTREHFIKQFNL